jgi:hypothetical protein
MIQFKKYHTLMCRLKDNISIMFVCSVVVVVEEEEKGRKRIIDSGSGSSYRYGRGTPVAFNCFIT